MARYKANNGQTLEAELYKKGMEDGICEKYNKPYIKNSDEKRYVHGGEYIFKMDGDKERFVLHKEEFENNTTLIN